MEILLIVIGLIVGALVGWLIGKSKSSAISARFDMQQKEVERLKQSADEQSARMATLTEELHTVRSERDRAGVELQSAQRLTAQAKEDYEKSLQQERLHAEQNMAALKESQQRAIDEQERRHSEAIEAQERRFKETMDKVTAQLNSATEQMLKERQKEFAEASQTNLGQLVNPLRETISEMKKAMLDNTEKQTSMSGEMRANLEQMMRQSQAAKESADELTRVFKHQSKVQGDWGETILDELLQSQGFTNGVHYDTQATMRDASGNTVRTEEGGLLRPDVILHLDTRRELIIDSKVSLTAFIDYVNAETDAERERALKDHIDSLQKHVKELSVKDYSTYVKAPKIKMDYVIMFVPHSAALWTALNRQPDLWRKAMEKNVFIADEQTLFAALRIINLTWTQIAQAQNHEKVYELAGQMLNRVGQFLKAYNEMGNALRKACKSYDEGRKKITDGGQSINTTANSLIKLGAKQSDTNPLTVMLDVDDIPPIVIPQAPVSADELPVGEAEVVDAE